MPTVSPVCYKSFRHGILPALGVGVQEAKILRLCRKVKASAHDPTLRQRAIDELKHAIRTGQAGSFVLYGTGQKIPQSGIYAVLHSGHRLPHEVTLLGGEIFPRCAKCGDQVEFTLIKAALLERASASFSVHLYALPDLDDTPPKALNI